MDGVTRHQLTQIALWMLFALVWAAVLALAILGSGASGAHP